MFGTHFYHQRIRTAVAVFGSLFNNIKIVRKNSSGGGVSQVKVPLSYAPKRDFIARLDAMADGENAERQIAVKLPRMSFEIVAMNYDAQRQLPKTNSCRIPSTYGNATEIYTPVPYNINFQLNVYARGQDDALQIVEQILPYFTPAYTLTTKPLSDFEGIKEDTPITMQGITFSDDFEATLEQRRTVIYTLDFEMKIMMYKATGTPQPVITQYDVENADLNGNVFFQTADSAASVTKGLSTSTSEDTAVSTDFQAYNVPLTTHGLRLGDSASNGEVSVVYTKRLVSASGIVVAQGTHTYTPDANFNGVDQYTLEILYGDSANPSTIEKTVNVTIGAVQDVVSTSLGPFALTVGVADIRDVSSNDPFTSPTYSIVSNGSLGNAIISASGLVTYDPQFAGTDTVTYGVTPSGGTRENVTITYNNSV
jgi:hypothetical protein